MLETRVNTNFKVCWSKKNIVLLIIKSQCASFIKASARAQTYEWSFTTELRELVSIKVSRAENELVNLVVCVPIRLRN